MNCAPEKGRPKFRGGGRTGPQSTTLSNGIGKNLATKKRKKLVAIGNYWLSKQTLSYSLLWSFVRLFCARFPAAQLPYLAPYLRRWYVRLQLGPEFCSWKIRSSKCVARQRWMLSVTN